MWATRLEWPWLFGFCGFWSRRRSAGGGLGAAKSPLENTAALAARCVCTKRRVCETLVDAGPCTRFAQQVQWHLSAAPRRQSAVLRCTCRAHRRKVLHLRVDAACTMHHALGTANEHHNDKLATDGLLIQLNNYYNRAMCAQSGAINSSPSGGRISFDGRRVLCEKGSLSLWAFLALGAQTETETQARQVNRASLSGEKTTPVLSSAGMLPVGALETLQFAQFVSPFAGALFCCCSGQLWADESASLSPSRLAGRSSAAAGLQSSLGRNRHASEPICHK